MPHYDGKTKSTHLHSHLCIAAFSASLLLATFFLIPQAHAAPKWNIQTVDTRASSSGGSLVLDSKNNPHVCYVDYLSFEQRYGDPYLMYAYWNGSGWDIQTVDPGGRGGSLVLDSNDCPHIGYFGGNGLTYASWNGSDWNMQTVDEPGGKTPSLALDSNNQPHISYYSDNCLKYAKLIGSTWNIQTVDSLGWVHSSSMALDSNNNPHIFYREFPDDILKYATWKNSNWSIQIVHSNAVSMGKIVIDSKGHPHLSYINEFITAEFPNGAFIANYTLNYVYWDGAAWKTQTVDSETYSTWYEAPALALDSDDKPHICFYKKEYVPSINDTGLMYAKWTGSKWNTQTLDTESYMRVGSMAMDSHGNPHISYSKPRGTYLTFGNLMYATLTGSTDAAGSLFFKYLPVGLLLAFIITVTLVIIGYRRRKSVISCG